MIKEGIKNLISFGNGVYFGIGESLTYGVTGYMDDYGLYYNVTAYQGGKIVGNLFAIAGGVVGTFAGVATGVFTAPTGAGALAGSAAAYYSASVSVSGAISAGKNIVLSGKALEIRAAQALVTLVIQRVRGR